MAATQRLGLTLLSPSRQSRRKVSTVLREGSLTVEDDDTDYFTNVAVREPCVAVCA